MEDIENDLGGEMKYWTGIMANFGFKVKPVKKPCNNFAIKTTLRAPTKTTLKSKIIGLLLNPTMRA